MLDTITEVYGRAAKSFDWEPRDLVAINNMLVSHARLPYSGPHNILVAMGDIVRLQDLPPV